MMFKGLQALRATSGATGARLGRARLLVGRRRGLHGLQRLGQAPREHGYVVAQPLVFQLLPPKVHRAVPVVDLHLFGGTHGSCEQKVRAAEQTHICGQLIAGAQSQLMREDPFAALLTPFKWLNSIR